MNSFKTVSYWEDIVYIPEKDCILKTQSCQCFMKQKHLHGTPLFTNITSVHRSVSF